MISRRNIRVKVMQTLYTVDSLQGDMKVEEADKLLTKHLDQSRQLFAYLVYFLTEVARYAETDARLRASKHLPSNEDLHVNIKLAGNELVWFFLEQADFKTVVDEYKLNLLLNSELVRKIYIELTASKEYQAYIKELSREKKAEKKILEFIFCHLMLANDSFIDHIEENFIHWQDDADMMNQLVLHLLSKPQGSIFSDFISTEKWKYAKDLLRTVLEKKSHCQELITPKLKNWDAERIATLDMIIMEMGVAEFLYFETIPPKVTINEYIDIAKEYSTAQSGQFVNGILDNIHKELVADNKLHKINFKKAL
jgi:N utilization substance protein B